VSLRGFDSRPGINACIVVVLTRHGARLPAGSLDGYQTALPAVLPVAGACDVISACHLTVDMFNRQHIIFSALNVIIVWLSVTKTSDCGQLLLLLLLLLLTINSSGDEIAKRDFLHILAYPRYAPGTIAVNVTWTERGFNVGQKHRSIYPSIFNRLRAREIATFSYPLAFNAPILHVRLCVRLPVSVYCLVVLARKR